MVKIHYFFDPMCGWCYGATPLIQALAQMPEFDLVYHPGGMIHRRAIDSSFRQHILQADERIAEQTQVSFGDAYKARVAGEELFVLDSYITTLAFIVGKNMGVEPHLMLKAIQEAHYQKGERLDQLEALRHLALSLGLDDSEWEQNMASSNSELTHEITNSHVLMKQLRVSGFPTLVADLSSGFRVLPISTYYGNTPAWRDFLTPLA